jgi:GTPase SAR1 family protein
MPHACIFSAQHRFRCCQPHRKYLTVAISELQEIIDILQQDTARIAILGAGGMGKTSLATAVIHNQSVVAKYQLQYFVGCHSAATRSDLVASISTYIGVEKGPGLLRRVVHHFKFGPPSLLVLDNFEIIWEPKSSRTEVEDFLSLLADVSHLAIIASLTSSSLVCFLSEPCRRSP